ncbi:tyrosine-type recombinase/integrase [Thiocapsa marina]|uniref:tyrosine-type recombinase/integrase n=1 Tax=Thiocapsa marina TaxID=244573 RepID=UPI0002DAA06A|nr:site-specific integrase [Thiocapsa marina]
MRTATCAQGKQKTDFYSDSLQGFILEVRATGNKTYYLRYRDPFGRLRAQKIGSAADVSFEKAQKAAIQLKAKITLGEDPGKEKKRLKQIPTLEELIRERYMPHIQTAKRRPDFDEGIIRLHLLPKFGRHRLAEIDAESIQAWHQLKSASGLSPAYCNAMVGVLRRIFNLAKRWGVPGAEVNPTANVTLLEVDNIKEVYLTAEQTERLITAVNNSSNTQLRYIVPLLLLTGARKRELLDAKWEDIDQDRREWRIPLTKSGKPRKVPLSKMAIEVFETVPRFPDCPYVVPNPSTLQPFKSIWGSWTSARTQAGMPGLRLHDLRHSFASALVNAGRSIYEVQKLLGHAKVTTTERYAHLANQTLLDATDAAAQVTGITVSGH